MANKRVLVVAAHPDDEILGVGGTVARHVEDGDTVHVLIVAEGATSRDTDRDVQGRRDELAGLMNAAREAAQILGYEFPEMLGLADNRLDTVALLDVVKAVERVVASCSPQVVYTHHGGDLNVDHRVVHQAVMTACRPLPGCGPRAIYAFETVSSTEWSTEAIGDVFRPNHFVDIGAQLDRKMRALEAYASEMADFPHARSLENVRALATVRGASVGLEAAEAFMLLREVVA